MPRKKKPGSKPADEFKVIKLRRAGPKPGQSVDAYLYGKAKGYERLLDNPGTTMRVDPRRPGPPGPA